MSIKCHSFLITLRIEIQLKIIIFTQDMQQRYQSQWMVHMKNTYQMDIEWEDFKAAVQSWILLLMTLQTLLFTDRCRKFMLEFHILTFDLCNFPHRYSRGSISPQTASHSFLTLLVKRSSSHAGCGFECLKSFVECRDVNEYVYIIWT